MDPLTIGGILSAGGSILGGLFQGRQARRAAQAQEGIAREQIDLFRQAQEQQTNALAPFLSGGTTANDAYLYEMGLGPRPTVGGTPAQITTIAGQQIGGGGVTAAELQRARGMRQRGPRFEERYQELLARSRQPATFSPTQYEVNGQRFGTLEDAQAFARANPVGGTPYGERGTGFTRTPGYDFRLRQGMDALESSAAARGRLFSGATMQAATEFGQDYATNEYQNYMNRLADLSGRGQNAAAGQGLIFGAGATNIGNALGSIGDARSAGMMAQGTALTDGIDNAISAYSYFNNLPGSRAGQGNRNFQGGGRTGGFTFSPFA